MKTEQYWIRENGEEIAVADMNEHHAKAALRQIMHDVASMDRLSAWEHIGQEAEYVEEINAEQVA